MLLPRLFGPAAEHLVPTRGTSGLSRLNLAALLFTTGLVRVASAQVAPTVTVNNLTHPDIAPNFLAGDTYQYIVVGDPNQPVYNVQNSGPMAQVGQTDASGNFQASGIEQAAWAGNYTQTWYVGSAQASPSLSFTVGLAAVVASNLTHPDLSPSFAVGDTYQYTVYGPPNQPVYNIQNSGQRNQVGQTDSSGKYVTSGIEQTAWIGSYTQLGQ